MYEAYWQLDQKPFDSGWNETFYYPSEVHQGALLKLRYAIENRCGAMLLTGTAGVGKTLLVASLRRQLAERFAPIAHVVFPQMPTDQLLAYVADELSTAPPTVDNGPMAGGQTIQQSVGRIAGALKENTDREQHALLVIDEAHLLAGPESFEALRLLLNFQTGTTPDLTLLLVGQTRLLPLLDRMPTLEQRLGVKCLLRPFTLEETASYISHRLAAAGASRPIFESEALDTIHQLSGGIPRSINRLCDLCLLISFAEERQTIGSQQVETVSGELVCVSPE